MVKKRKNTSGYMQANFFMIAAGCLLLLYIYLLVCVYPFLIEPGYGETTRVKLGFLISVSYGFLIGRLWIPSFIPLSLICVLAGTALYIKRSGKGIKAFVRSIRFSLTDILVTLYGIFAVISAILTPYRNDLIWGVELSNMGLASQFLFIFIYFITSRLFDLEELKVLVYASLLASSAVFAIGILQRFGYDIFDLYHGLENKLFISTIGQHTFFSAYLILFFMLGAFLVWICEPGSMMRRAAIVHLVIASCLPCILNADMIYAGLFFALSFMFVLSFESTERMKSFLETALIILFTWRILGIVWYLADPEFRLEPLSKFILLSPLFWIPVVCLALIYIFIRRRAGEKTGFDIRRYSFIGYAYAGLVGFMILIAIVYIILNTNRLLPKNLQSSANYLLFDAFWGNGRGAIWHDSVMSILGELKRSPLTAVFGAGPDQFFYVLDGYVHDWLVIYTDKIALYAHNEWLNAVVCYGFFGGIAYLGIFISAVVRFTKSRKGSPVALGAAVLLIAYLSHQMFGYQQYSSTPYIFLILGIGEQEIRRGRT
ncbi:MAG: O-antigen ligase family protein [Lachnospiraceae bacterium]|nr:O-antigen ligase family protein [Lachnospiraceae bacterium]